MYLLSRAALGRSSPQVCRSVRPLFFARSFSHNPKSYFDSHSNQHHARHNSETASRLDPSLPPREFYMTAYDDTNSSSFHVASNWRTVEDQPMTKETFHELLRNTISSIRHPGFLSRKECHDVAKIAKSQEVGSYDQAVVFPPIGSVGLTQYDHRQDKTTYFDAVPEAYMLQNQIKQETNIDIISRVAALLQKTTGLETRIAREGEREYFCGLLRVVDNYIQIHPDFGPFDGPGWEIGRISAQLTWNILLKQVPGGETIIYDRQWQGAEDDKRFQKNFPRYAYHPTTVQGRTFKALTAVEGDLTIFNPRNFHEVKPCDLARDNPGDLVRYTMSSFIGLLPGENGSPPTLIMWS